MHTMVRRQVTDQRTTGSPQPAGGGAHGRRGWAPTDCSLTECLQGSQKPREAGRCGGV